MERDLFGVTISPTAWEYKEQIFESRVDKSENSVTMEGVSDATEKGM